MKKTVLLITIGCLFFGCKKEETTEFPFDSLVLSESGLRHSISIKFTKSDTVFFQKRFPEPQGNFYAIIQSEEKIKLNKYFKKLDFNKFSSEYHQENLCDGYSCLINIIVNGKSKSISIYGNNAPKELYNYIDSLAYFKKNLKFISTKQIIDFGDLTSFLPPPPPPLKEN
ncbi:hypothetical protein [Flavobacterium sp. Root186]|uniref:DUF6438 domain-containing protein n=1 Tax=Flavobacterium sp. Root186 TaxID=1736485 RepID=UPI0006F43101|nr:hypothetical protein [Flavobacterium sp. Root186]KRB59310.1 hypothetical protein ASD98_22665 [Flavobacterium sp. Root186]